MPLPPPGAGLGPQLLAVVGRAGCQLQPLPWITLARLRSVAGLHPVGPPPGRRKAGSAGIKQMVSGRGKGQVFAPCLPSPPSPNG